MNLKVNDYYNQRCSGCNHHPSYCICHLMDEDGKKLLQSILSVEYERIMNDGREA